MLELRESSERVSLIKSVAGSLWGTSRDSRSFFHWLNTCWFLQPEVMGTSPPHTGTLGWRGLVWGWDSSLLKYPSWIFSTTRGCGTSPFHICEPPTSLDACGVFNSVVVRFLFSLISDGSEWWLFYNLVVILMWFCDEVTHVCLCCHLDWKSFCNF